MADQVSGRLSPWLRGQRIAASVPYLKGDVLDFGCGTAELAAHCRGRYVGVDIDAASLEIARCRFPMHRFESSLAEVEAPARFDTIVALAVIEHLPAPADTLRSFNSRLQRGGRIVLTTPHPSLEWAHTVGARLGLFSRDAAHEHQVLFDRKTLDEIASGAALRLARYRRFLFGANQLFVLASRNGPGE